jgi:hypothetical protein
MPKFIYNDIVRAKPEAVPKMRSDRAWVVGIFEDRPGPYFDKFPAGVVYTIEFEDGTSEEVHEDNLEADPACDDSDGERSSSQANSDK